MFVRIFRLTIIIAASYQYYARLPGIGSLVETAFKAHV